MTETEVVASQPVHIKGSDQTHLDYLRDEMQGRVQNVLDFQDNIRMEEAAMSGLKNLWRRFTSELVKKYGLEGNWEIDPNTWTLNPVKTVMEE